MFGVFIVLLSVLNKFTFFFVLEFQFKIYVLFMWSELERVYNTTADQPTKSTEEEIMKVIRIKLLVQRPHFWI